MYTYLTIILIDIYIFIYHSHRFVLGVYELQNRLTQAFPKVMIENCSSGGGRFDPGMLFYSSQVIEYFMMCYQLRKGYDTLVSLNVRHYMLSFSLYLDLVFG